MLPPEAKTYFDSLYSSASADAGIDLEQKQGEFERAEFARGRGPGGAGFAARLAVLYRESMSDRARAIVTAMETVHRSFYSPLGEGVEAQPLDWGSRALATAHQGLEGAYVRYLERFGVYTTQVVGLEQTYALARASVANLLSRVLWELRNVPTRRPEQPVAAVPMQVNIHNSGTIGSLQTGAGSTAYVQQEWGQGEKSALLTALENLRDRLDQAQDVEPDLRAALIADVDKASVELRQETPNKGRLLRWLGGIGAVIGAVGSVQPAYEAVKDLARALGLSI